MVAVEDLNWKAETKGLPGQQMGLQLVLRVVADIGIVGFPNAGEGRGRRAGCLRWIGEEGEGGAADGVAAGVEDGGGHRYCGLP